MYVTCNWLGNTQNTLKPDTTNKHDFQTSLVTSYWQYSENGKY